MPSSKKRYFCPPPPPPPNTHTNASTYPILSYIPQCFFAGTILYPCFWHLFLMYQKHQTNSVQKNLSNSSKGKWSHQEKKSIFLLVLFKRSKRFGQMTVKFNFFLLENLTPLISIRLFDWSWISTKVFLKLVTK